MRAKNESTFHQPNVVVQPDCLTGCSRLAGLVTGAVVEAVNNPKQQRLIVCEKYGRLVCHGRGFPEGLYGSTFGEEVEDSDRYFLVNPGSYGHDISGGRSVSSRIDSAIANGAEVLTTQGNHIVPSDENAPIL